MMHQAGPTVLLPMLAALVSTAHTHAQAPPREAPLATVVTLGDSITKGSRAGVSSDETFSALVASELRANGINAQVVNLGVGGERTDQVLRRLDAVSGNHPRVVTVMYGTNDSYVDPGQATSRLTLPKYKANLRTIVGELLARGIEPVLMTEPRWAADAPPDG